MSEETGVTGWVRREYTGVAELRGPLLVVRGVTGVGWDEFATIRLGGGETRHGLVLEADRDLAVVQVLGSLSSCVCKFGVTAILSLLLLS